MFSNGCVPAGDVIWNMYHTARVHCIYLLLINLDFNVSIIAVCSHRRAYYYYGEAIAKTGSFMGVACESYDHFKNDKCTRNANQTIDIGNSLYDMRLVHAEYAFRKVPTYLFSRKFITSV